MASPRVDPATKLSPEDAARRELVIVLSRGRFRAEQRRLAARRRHVAQMGWRQ